MSRPRSKITQTARIVLSRSVSVISYRQSDARSAFGSGVTDVWKTAPCATTKDVAKGEIASPTHRQASDGAFTRAQSTFRERGGLAGSSDPQRLAGDFTGRKSEVCGTMTRYRPILRSRRRPTPRRSRHRRRISCPSCRRGSVLFAATGSSPRDRRRRYCSASDPGRPTRRIPAYAAPSRSAPASSLPSPSP